jgi:DNA polymerase-3 subunit alpha
MGFDAYFLIVWDLCRHAHDNGIWYNARGSAAGSIVAYALDITIVDPLQHGLIFERFLNPGRIEMPDIDLDFRDDRRAQMLEYCANKYGHDRVAQIITFGTMGAKAALRDVGRVMDIPLPEVDRLAKLVPFVPGKPVTLEDARQVPEFRQAYESQPHMRELVDTAQLMEGAVRNAGTHAAGVVISDRPLIEYLPLHRPTSGAEETPIRTVTQFEMNMLGSLGLLKVDFLGLATLTTMARACDLIQQRHGKQFDLGNIPLDDPGAFELLGSGQTLGVFQVEGSGMTRWLLQMKPKTLDHVIAMVALFRPGPMQFIPEYIARMHGKAEVKYLHESLKPIFGETFGIPVYQEQLMNAAVKLGGYTPSEADDLRKAISKKIADKLLKHREKFVKGAVGNGIPVETANQIFTDWEEFARYGFNKSHSADYGVLAVQTAFLKAHYPAEYMAALLSVTRHETEKVALYVAEARTQGVPVLQPDINASDWDFTIADADGQASIRFGLGAIKNVGEGSVKTILSAREAGPFTSLNDFARRVDLRGVGKRALECLIKVGALDGFGDRAGLLESLDRVVMASASHFRAADAGQMSLFEGVQGASHEIHITNNLHIDRREMLNWERELVGLYISAHPLTEYQPVLAGWVTHFSAQLQEATHEERARVAGLITAVRPYVTKQGKPMGFVTLEDVQGNIELLLFPRLWKDSQPLLEKGKIVFVEGKIDTQSSPPKVLVDSIKTEINMLVPAAGSPSAAEAGSQPAPRAGTNRSTSVQGRAAGRGPHQQSSSKTKPRNQTVVAETAKEEPLPPDNFPEGWDTEWQPAFEHAAAAAKSEATNDPEGSDGSAAAPSGGQADRGTAATAAQARPALPASMTASTGERTRALAETSGLRIPPMYGQTTPRPGGDERQPQQITVLLRASGDIERDKRRIKTIHGTLISFHGRDRFSFQIYEAGKGHLIDFPNDTTRICSQMLDRLQKLIGDKTWRVEEITLQ